MRSCPSQWHLLGVGGLHQVVSFGAMIIDKPSTQISIMEIWLYSLVGFTFNPVVGMNGCTYFQVYIIVFFVVQFQCTIRVLDEV